MENTNEETKVVKKKRKWWFRLLKQIMKIKYKKPRNIFLGEEFQNGAIILSNHEGTYTPMAFEIHCDKPTRMWGTYEMNSGIAKMYNYQTKVYYHQKKHWNLGLARLFCLIATPLTNLFYAGLNLISTYPDGRLRTTIKESCKTIQEGQNIVIYPEDSSAGYLPEMTGFHAGFTLLCDALKRQNIDVPIYVSYYRKSDNTQIFDKPIRYSKLLKKYKTRERIADKLRLRCNELGKMFLDETKSNKEVNLQEAK